MKTVQYEISNPLASHVDLSAAFPFFLAIIHLGTDKDLQQTLASISRQKYPADKLEVKIFHSILNVPGFEVQEGIELIPYKSESEFFSVFVNHINQSNAAYCSMFCSGDSLFDYSLEVIAKTFDENAEIKWLTGIQTVQAEQGFNIVFGSIATRRWNYKIFERNLYKKSGRYIPAGSTFWRRSVWDSASPHLYFVLFQNFWEDMWLAFFKVAELYTSNIYISSSSNYDTRKIKSSVRGIGYSLLEDDFIERAQEFFFMNNVPYLRLFYRRKNKLVPVVRYDHRSQNCFLNPY